MLEPGGTFYIQRKVPTTGALEHDAVMGELADLRSKLDALLEARGQA